MHGRTERRMRHVNVLRTIARREVVADGPTASGRGGGAVGRAPTRGRDDDAARTRLGQGDAATFRGVYQRHAPHVYGYLLHVLGDRQEAEDVLQEVFVTLWRSLAHYDPQRGSVRAWLMAMARSRALDRLRGRRREQSLMGDEIDAARELRALELALAAGEEERLENTDVRQAVRLLPEEQRHALFMVYYLGFSQSEAARHLVVPLGTLKSRLRLSLGRLRRLLEMDSREE